MLVKLKTIASMLISVAVVVAIAGCGAVASRSFEGARASSAPSSSAQSEPAAGFASRDAPAYAGELSAEVNAGIPFFAESDFSRGPFEEYAPLDGLGRCGAAFALVGNETMPNDERGSIGMIKPSGWHTVRYDGIVDGGYLYNRCHLIGYQLTGENANERNLITGTRSMNVQGMLPYEDRVSTYVESTGNHVLYRATPVFDGDDLVARGVLLEAESVEDGGAGVRFCAWCFNVEPGIEIDYATGESFLADGAGESAVESGTGSEAEGVEAGPGADGGAEVAEEHAYVLNTRSRKFHKPDCPSVDDMAEHNKRFVESTRQAVIDEGYEPCQRCNP